MLVAQDFMSIGEEQEHVIDGIRIPTLVRNSLELSSVEAGVCIYSWILVEVGM